MKFIINSLFANSILATASIGNSKKLLNLAKICINLIKYNSQNKSFILKLANLWKNALNTYLKNF